jgi:hypothetical protein
MNQKNISRHKKLLIIVCLFFILFGLLPGTGCNLFTQSDSTYTPKVISDGTGGTIVVYEEVKSGNERDFYTQRINSAGKPLWGENGTLIGSSQSNSYSFPVFDIVGDGAGGAIVAWPDLSPGQFQNTMYISKVDSNGNIVWKKNFAFINQLISDGDGGVIIALDGSSTTGNSNDAPIVVIRIDSQGNCPWGQQGVAIPRRNYWSSSLQVISDGANGVIAV